MEIVQAPKDHFAAVGRGDELQAGHLRKAVIEAAIGKAYLRPEMVVAAIGWDTGLIAAGLASIVSQVYAVSDSAAAQQGGGDNSAGLSNIARREVASASLPFEDGSLDAVFAVMYLARSSDPQAAIAEVVRVLRPGGRLVVIDWERHAQDHMRREPCAPVPGAPAIADERLGFGRRQIKDWLGSAGLVNLLLCSFDEAGRVASPVHAAVGAQLSVLVATGSRRVSGAREAVEANYGALAESGSCCAGATDSSCCSPTTAIELVAAAPSKVVSYDTDYSPEQLSAVPPEAADLSLGCGNPTALASLRPGEVVLDIGSGAGIDAFYAARRVGSAGRVIGLDMTPAMIERARQSATAAGLSQVEFRLGRADAIPVEDGSVDVILSNCVINLAEDKGRVFEEAYRVLRAGGRLSISDMVTEGPLPMALRSQPHLWAGCIHGALPEQEYLDLVRGAGFSDIEAVRTLSSGELADVPVYSLSVRARKSAAAA